MTAHPYIIVRRAESVGDLAQTFHHIDAGRLDYVAEILDQCDRPYIAEMVRGWASEHRATADRLSGAVAIGACASLSELSDQDDAEVTASAIAFGGPLPIRRAAE